MRFEVRTGGVFAILLGLTALSGAVFIMGLMCGWDVGRQAKIEAQKAVVQYPVSEPPASAATVVTHTASAESALPANSAPAGPKAVPVSAVASNPKPPTLEDDHAGVPAVAPSPLVTRAAAPVPVPHHKRYYVSIEALMDAESAAEMMERLEELGYHPRRFSTTIDGQTGYGVKVGPYANKDEAAAAKDEMKQQYDSTYDNGNMPAESTASSQPPEE